MKPLELHIDEILTLCKKHNVRKLSVFGSFLTSRFNKNSDIDFLVDFNKDSISDYFSNYFDLKYALEKIFQRNVDLVEEQTIRNKYLKESIYSNYRVIYG